MSNMADSSRKKLQETRSCSAPHSWYPWKPEVHTFQTTEQASFIDVLWCRYKSFFHFAKEVLCSKLLKEFNYCGENLL